MTYAAILEDSRSNPIHTTWGWNRRPQPLLRRDAPSPQVVRLSPWPHPGSRPIRVHTMPRRRRRPFFDCLVFVFVSERRCAASAGFRRGLLHCAQTLDLHTSCSLGSGKHGCSFPILEVREEELPQIFCVFYAHVPTAPHPSILNRYSRLCVNLFRNERLYQTETCAKTL